MEGGDDIRIRKPSRRAWNGERLTVGEVLRERRGARERAEGRLRVEVKGVPDAGRYRGVLARSWGRPRAGLGLRGAGAVAGARGCDCRCGEGGEGGGEEGEEVHDYNGVDDVGRGEVVGYELSSGVDA